MEFLSERIIMMKRIRNYGVVMVAACILLACTLGDTRPPAIRYDLGPLRMENPAAVSANMPVIKTVVHAPEWMAENLMFYRLDYINDQQVRFYTESSWNTSPSRLFKSRLDAYLTAGGMVVTHTKTLSPTLTLRVYLEDFCQYFSDPSHSVSRVVLNASLFKGNVLIAQKRFEKDVPALTADAAGGAKAFERNSDVMIGEIINWMKEQAR